MDPSRSKGNDDERFGRLEARVSAVEKRQGRMQRSLRNRPTKWQVRQILAKSGTASNQAVLVAVIGLVGVVIAAAIAAYVQLKTNVPVPMPPTR